MSLLYGSCVHAQKLNTHQCQYEKVLYIQHDNPAIAIIMSGAQFFLPVLSRSGFCQSRDYYFASIRRFGFSCFISTLYSQCRLYRWGNSGWVSAIVATWQTRSANDVINDNELRQHHATTLASTCPLSGPVFNWRRIWVRRFSIFSIA